MKRHDGKLRVFLCGQRWFGAETFRALRTAPQVAIVGVSSPAHIDGKPDRLTRQAALHGALWMPSGTLRADTLPEGVDLIVAAHSHDFIGERTRLRATYGGIGYHPSLLPLHRGRDAVRWTIRMGDRIAGGSVYRLSNRVDGGDVLAQDWCHVRPGDTADELWRRDLGPIGLRLLTETVTRIAAEGDIDGTAQDEELATWEPAFGAAPLARPDLIMIGRG